MLNMTTFLNKVDIYGEDIKLTIDSKEKINSSCGGFFAIITFIVVILFSWFIGNDIIFKVQPLSYLDFAISENYPNLTLKNDFFPFAFCLTDIVSYPFKNESILTFEFIKKEFLYNEKSGILELNNIKKIKLVECTKSHFPTITENQFQGAALPTFFCPEIDDYFVEGYWSQSSLSYYSFSIKKCDYDLHPDKCDSKENIDKIVSSLGLNYNLITIENIVSVGNYKNPILPTILISYKFLHVDNLKITNFLIQKNKLFTDNAFFSTSQNEEKFAKLVELQTDLIKIDNDTKEMAQMNFYSSNRSDHFFRKYIKITDILASVGGLLKVFMIIFSILIKPMTFLEKTKILFNYIKSYEVGKEFIKKIDLYKMTSLDKSLITKNETLNKRINMHFDNQKNCSNSKLNKVEFKLEKNNENCEKYMKNNFIFNENSHKNIIQKNKICEMNSSLNHLYMKSDNNNLPRKINCNNQKVFYNNFNHDKKNTHLKNLDKENLLKFQELLGIKSISFFMSLVVHFICSDKKAAENYKHIVGINKSLISLFDINNLLLKVIELETKLKNNKDDLKT